MAVPVNPSSSSILCSGSGLGFFFLIHRLTETTIYPTNKAPKPTPAPMTVPPNVNIIFGDNSGAYTVTNTVSDTIPLVEPGF